MSVDLTKFGERLNRLRVEKGLSQEKLAQELGYSKGAISFYELGKRTPDIVFLDVAARYFDVSLDYLMGYNGNRTTDANLKAVCDYTNLTEKAVGILHDLPSVDEDIRLTIIYLLEQYLDKLSVDLFPEFGCCASPCDESILNEISKYLRIVPDETIDRYYISESGRLINSMSTDLQVTNSIKQYKDIITARQINTKVVIDRMLLDSLEETLKCAKSEYKNVIRKYPNPPLDGEALLSEDSILKMQEKAEETMRKINKDFPF